jgi:cell fate regulator YaaT (PSP1 superfamily)
MKNIVKAVGIRFKPGGKIYNFDSGIFVFNKGDKVIVETEQGFSLGFVMVEPFVYELKEDSRQLKKVFKPAGEKDLRHFEQNKQLEKEAYDFCRDCIKELDLKMNLFNVETTYSADKLTFFFTAEGRVDFRELLKMLSKQFEIRIEMRQVGVRYQAKICGGIGRCGREICCSSHMKKFIPVAVKVVKEQGILLNSSKISGLCGRLMCCLMFEEENIKNIKESNE